MSPRTGMYRHDWLQYERINRELWHPCDILPNGDGLTEHPKKTSK